MKNKKKSDLNRMEPLVGKTLAEVFAREDKKMSSPILDKLTLSDIESIELDNSGDTLTVKLMLPLDEGTYSEYEETISLDDEMPEGLHAIAKKFSEAVLRAVQSRAMKSVEIPCATCMGACCYKYDEVRLTLKDIGQMVAALGDKAREGIEMYESGTRWTGYAASLRKKPRTISGRMVDEACYFLRDNGCSIYEHRPTVCREYSPWTCGDTYEADPKKVSGKVRLRVL